MARAPCALPDGECPSRGEGGGCGSGGGCGKVRGCCCCRGGLLGYGGPTGRDLGSSPSVARTLGVRRSAGPDLWSCRPWRVPRSRCGSHICGGVGLRAGAAGGGSREARPSSRLGGVLAGLLMTRGPGSRTLSDSACFTKNDERYGACRSGSLSCRCLCLYVCAHTFAWCACACMCAYACLSARVPVCMCARCT